MDEGNLCVVNQNSVSKVTRSCSDVIVSIIDYCTFCATFIKTLVERFKLQQLVYTWSYIVLPDS